MIDPEYNVGPEVNWYFMFVSTFADHFLGAFVTEKIVEPKLDNTKVMMRPKPTAIDGKR